VDAINNTVTDTERIDRLRLIRSDNSDRAVLWRKRHKRCFDLIST
jgi:hypothetical protein